MSERLFASEVERKLKRMMEEPPTMDASESEVLLSLTLGSNKKNIVAGSSSSNFSTALRSFNNNNESTPLRSFNNNNENNNNSLVVAEAERQRQFPCKFCNKKFPSSQALGGHQNAHRRERVMSKMEREYQLGTFGVPKGSANANGINIGGHNLCPLTFGPHHHQYPLSGPSFCHAYGSHHMHQHHPMHNLASPPHPPHPHHHHTMSWPRFAPGYGMNPYDQMMNNSSWGAHQVPQVPNSLAGGDAVAAANRNAMTQAGIDAFMGNRYVGNQKMPSSFPDLSFN